VLAEPLATTQSREASVVRIRRFERRRPGYIPLQSEMERETKDAPSISSDPQVCGNVHQFVYPRTAAGAVNQHHPLFYIRVAAADPRLHSTLVFPSITYRYLLRDHEYPTPGRPSLVWLLEVGRAPARWKSVQLEMLPT